MKKHGFIVSLALILALGISQLAYSATYAELAWIKNEAGWGAFFDKVRVATLEKARIIIDQTAPTAEAKEWAENALQSPNATADAIVLYVVISNKGLTLSVILGASDTAVQNNVNAAVDALYGAGT